MNTHHTNNINEQEEYEKAIISMILGDNRNNKQFIIPSLCEGMFLNPTYRKFFKVISNLFDKNKEINVFSVCEKMDLQEQKFLLFELEKQFISNINWKYYTQKLAQNYIERAYTQATSSKEIDKINKERAKYIKHSPVSNISDKADNIMKDYVNSSFTAITTGYTQLDDLIGSWQGGDFILLAGAPSMGKTCLALNLIKNIANKNKKILLFSLEMPRKQLQNRIICSDLGIENDKIRKFNFTEDEIERYEKYIKNELPKLNCDICDNANIYIDELINIIKSSDADMFFIDYLGLINSDNKNGAYEKYSDISRMLKITAMEIDKPILALHQLNRASAERKDKRPKLSDIRDSGKIEQDVDSVLFVFRPYYYDKKLNLKDLFQVLVPKNRNGKTGVANLLYNASTQKISNRIEVEDFQKGHHER